MLDTGKTLITVLIAISAISCTKHSDTWNALTLTIPTEVQTMTAFNTPVIYLLTQTHETIFRQIQNGDIDSRILIKWNRSADSKKLTMCPNTELKFDDEHSFSIEHLTRSVNLLKKRFPEITVTTSENCLSIDNNSGVVNIIDELTHFEYAPTIESKINGVELGLGSFSIISKTNKQIILIRKVSKEKRINKINFILQSTILDSKELFEIDDFNYVYEVPDWVASKYVSLPVQQLKEYALLIDHVDPIIRKIIWNCTDIVELRKIYLPSNTNINDVATVFPVGISGAVEGKPNQSCNIDLMNKIKKTEVTFLNWNEKILTALNTFFSKQIYADKIKVKIRQVTPTQMNEMLIKRLPGFNLSIIACDTIYQQYVSFFEPYLDPEKSLFHKMDKALMDDFVKFRTSSIEMQKLVSIKINNKITEDKNFVLPLGQLAKTMFFPKNLKKITAGTSRLGVIDISELEIE